ncbi:MAG TPA: 16S rRNA (adenine(1518)-N(6)/adenine(1519)-N(6))-dimethyltransferase RsmA [Bacteroidales bacterium]|jgi:16S rRNA (adenine1518-N6/adenine1519-N6)-dimethyltransferase|nr:ribosomal RNA small subunit methyltransferase A [Bacteroidales bacterium]HNV96350.1 16S rRNA (adenine(1518)-N(6)/adenine(1519)-N(6))-dimethyltransferase RsmA [Bacteroidales bacterium]HOU97882.1 16S rRNA (adenine(1518)-N(6)/adenine(1519)-N(6))-dimethyltransferase RsmA [Bacteroidales bacterium]
MRVKPKKQLGQHFLHDKNIAQKIVNVLTDAPSIIEIGAGTGVLSSILQNKFGAKVLYFDIDTESIQYLKDELKLPEKQVVCQDFLTYDFSAQTDKIHIIGNFPYNISSQIFFKILEQKDKVEQVVCMIQKEVAERIATSQGTKTYGILSVLLQAFYEIKYHFTVNENVFIPPPKVKSAVIELKRNNVIDLGCDEKLFFKVVKTAFNQRRKMLSNSLSELVSKDKIPNQYSCKRPEQLSVSDFVELTKHIDFDKSN